VYKKRRISNFQPDQFEIENPKSEIPFVARPGFEPRQTVPKTVVLPLYYQAISFGLLSIPKRNANIGGFFITQK
jgi:hypothetical protein